MAQDDGLWRPRIWQSGDAPSRPLSRPASAPCLRHKDEASVRPVSPARSTRSTRALLRKGGFSALAEVKTSKTLAEAKTLHPTAKSRSASCPKVAVDVTQKVPPAGKTKPLRGILVSKRNSAGDERYSNRWKAQLEGY
eukprot:Skav234468  [mRNA]  locus=scaffold1647:265502:266043:+ [translate_table: standard]